MNILITNNATLTQKGDAMILEGLLLLLKKRIREPKFIILSTHPELISTNYHLNSYLPLFDTKNGRKIDYLIHALNLFRLTIWSCFFFISKKNISKILPQTSRRALKEYMNTDLIVSVGGSYMHDFYHPAIFGRLVEYFFAKIVLKKKVILWAHSIGPFNSRFYRSLATYVLNKVDIITTRDKQSLTELKNLRITKPVIFQTYDSSFGLAPIQIQKKRLQYLLKKEGITGKRNVSISVCSWNYYSKKSKNKQDDYIRIMAQTADYLVESYKAHIYFLSISIARGGIGQDDREIATSVMRHMKHTQEAKIITAEYSALDIITFYSAMDFHIGTRMHSTIFAMLANTPAINIAYEFKAWSLYRMMGLLTYIVSIETVTFQDIKKRIQSLLKENKKLKKHIPKKISEFQKKAYQDSAIFKQYET